MAKPEWITIGTVEGSMNGSSEITAAAHTGRVAREGNITVTTAGGVTDTTSISQIGANEVITIEKTEYRVAAVGQKITIQGKSNAALLILTTDIPETLQSPELAIAGVKDTAWDGVENVYVTGDPGASAMYDFTITLTIPENKSTSEVVGTLTIDSNVSSPILTITQAAGVKNYAPPQINEFSYGTPVDASGGSITPRLTYSQIWGWNESKTNGGRITGDLVDPIEGTVFAFTGSSVNATTGVATVASKGTVVSGMTSTTITATVTVNGKTSAPKEATLRQIPNSANYGEVTIGQATPVSLAVQGETYTIVPALKQTVTYTSGATRTESTPVDNKVQLSADYTVKTAKEGFSLETNTGKVTVTPNPTTAPRNGFVVTISAEGEGGKTATKDITFNQLGSASTLDISPDTLSFIAAGETKTVTITSNDSWTLS